MITEITMSREPDAVRFMSETGTTKAVRNAAGEYECGDAVLGITKSADGIQTSLTGGKTPIKFIQLRWNGGFKQDTKFMGDAFERGYGNIEWRGFVPDRIMAWYFLASDKKDTKGFGVMVRPNAFAWWMTDQQGVTLWLDVRCGGKGVILDGKTLPLATLAEDSSQGGESAYDFLCRFCGRLCTDPILPKEPVYGSNNWYYAYGNSSHEEILKDTALLAELTKGLNNRPYMVIDDCWQPLSLSQGAAGRPYENGNIRFPDMRGLASEMKEMGVKPGIWIRPEETNEMFINRKLRCDRNEKVFDLTEPDALRLIGEDVQRVVSWGYEFVKFDFATYDALGDFAFTNLHMIRINSDWAWHDRSQTNAQAIMNVYRVIRENAGDAVILGCNVVGHLGAGLMHMHRSGDDTSGHSWDRTVIMGVNTLAFRLAQHNKFFAIDADCVGITGQIDWRMNKEFLRLLSLSGTPLFCSTKPSAVDDEMKKDLSAAFVAASKQQNVMKPLDWFETSIPTKYEIDGEEHKFNWMQAFGMDGFSS